MTKKNEADSGPSDRVRLKDYARPPWLVENIRLDFRLDPKSTRVFSRIAFKRNPLVGGGGDLFLNGRKLALRKASIDGAEIPSRFLALGPEGMTVSSDFIPGDCFSLETEVEISPAGNSELEGLYISNGMYCTQCEPEGFRRITYYPDRPDVMASFDVRIESELPVLLSNGNFIDSGQGWAEWSDPWPKPSYLFALVAGDLKSVDDRFLTRSGRDVDLRFWVRDGDQDRCAIAIDALKKSMAWDEDNYGREYDLDIFQVVAVDDFNMGAMENKSLNVFNSKFVLASPETSTDEDIANVQSVIAHEYFHNWTGNRITCRDWFQLSLKEGLTVYRDAQFYGDLNSRDVKRIKDVDFLRKAQFKEDSSPLAHPVRPEEYSEINNFYTATVYLKGSELIRMLHLLHGEDGYRRALDLYFERHDGMACTIEDWLKVFEDACQSDLSQFKRWYSQAGTPRLRYSDKFENGVYTLRLEQEIPPSPGRSQNEPLHIPVAVGLLDEHGSEVLPTTLLELSAPAQQFSFDGLERKPVPSILRGLSAPVILEGDASDAELVFLLANDTDSFNKNEAARTLATRAVEGLIGEEREPSRKYLNALAAAVSDDELDPALRSLLLSFPTDEEFAGLIFQSQGPVCPRSVHEATNRLKSAVAASLATDLEDLAGRDIPATERSAAAWRSLRLAALSLLSRIDSGRRAESIYASARNMTDQIKSLHCLLEIGKGARQLEEFFNQWSFDRIVTDKWFAAQSANAAPEKASQVIEELARHPEFKWRNPNRYSSLIDVFWARNYAGFHNSDGSGYRLVADWIIKLDGSNPQVASRSCSAFSTLARQTEDRRQAMQNEIKRIDSHPGLSKNTREMTRRFLAEFPNTGSGSA